MQDLANDMGNLLDQLARLIEQERDVLLARWRLQVRELPAARHLDMPTLNDHLPQLLVELAAALRSRSEETIAQALVQGTSPAHGLQRVMDGFDIEEVVAEYNILRGCIHDLANENGLSLQGRSFHVLNRVLDGAIGGAVQSFAAQKAREVQLRREDYLAFVAHDLRTPLSVISLAARVLEMLHTQETTPPAQAAKMLKALNRNVQHLEALVGKVLEETMNLDPESGVKLERRNVELWPMVEGLIHDLGPIAGTGSTRLTNTVAEDFVIFADASLLRRVLQNLIANAISYTPGGEVIVGAQETADGSGVACFVRDNGGGIPADRCNTVFDKLETDPGKAGGLGLGLAIVKTFVEAHEGTVTVESELGVGTTFWFTLPKRSR